jgi:hypothetical protein
MRPFNDVSARSFGKTAVFILQNDVGFADRALHK